MAKAQTERPFAPAGFFSFRTPLLPFDELEAFGRDVATATGLTFVANVQAKRDAAGHPALLFAPSLADSDGNGSGERHPGSVAGERERAHAR